MSQKRIIESLINLEFLIFQLEKWKMVTFDQMVHKLLQQVEEVLMGHILIHQQ
jgi:hypothetical protein